MQAGQVEFAFRLTEMILVCGVVFYIEKRLGIFQFLSGLLSAFVAIYARSYATASLLELMKLHELDPQRQRRIFWVIVAVTMLLFLGILLLINWAVPRIADFQ